MFTIIQFWVVDMSVLISFRFLLNAAAESFGQVGICLVGNAEQYPEDVGYLFVQIVLFTGLERLVAVLSGHDAGQFAHFLGQYSHIGAAVVAADVQALELMKRKNHDYDEAWRSMRVSSYTDFILTKLQRIKEIEDLDGKTLVSEGVEGNYMDIINYAVFGAIKLGY